LVDGHVTAICGVKDLSKDPTIAISRAGHISGAVDKDSANAGGSFYGGDTPARFADNRRRRGDSDIAECILSDGNSVSRSGDSSGEANAQIRRIGLRTPCCC
jgi:hypothetical protein